MSTTLDTQVYDDDTVRRELRDVLLDAAEANISPALRAALRDAHRLILDEDQPTPSVAAADLRDAFATSGIAPGAGLASSAGWVVANVMPRLVRGGRRPHVEIVVRNLATEETQLLRLGAQDMASFIRRES
jgi:hypothetical protein